jgi:ABC-type polysaccharide/polyol phosphate export permease
MTGLLGAYRNVLMSRSGDLTGYEWISFVVCWVVFGLGLQVFRKNEGRFADEL